METASRLWTAMKLAIGRARICFVTPTNICNARCSFCDVWRERDAHHAPIGELCRALDRLHDLGVRFIQLTGGEPLLHPDLDAAVRHARSLGITVNVITNGSLLREHRMERLLAAGVDVLALSVDHHDPAEHEKSRGIPGLWTTIERAVTYFRNARVPVLASTVITRLNHDTIPETVATAREAGFSGIGFTYPTLHTRSSYPVGRNATTLQLEPQEMEASLLTLLSLKENGFPIFNSRSGLRDELRRVRGRRSRHPCRAGDGLLFLDHRLHLHRCMVLEESYGPVLDVAASRLRKGSPCDLCSMMCFREPSILSGSLHSVPALLEHAWLAFRTQALA